VAVAGELLADPVAHAACCVGEGRGVCVWGLDGRVSSQHEGSVASWLDCCAVCCWLLWGWCLFPPVYYITFFKRRERRVLRPQCSRQPCTVSGLIGAQSVVVGARFQRACSVFIAVVRAGCTLPLCGLSACQTAVERRVVKYGCNNPVLCWHGVHSCALSERVVSYQLVKQCGVLSAPRAAATFLTPFDV